MRKYSTVSLVAAVKGPSRHLYCRMIVVVIIAHFFLLVLDLEEEFAQERQKVGPYVALLVSVNRVCCHDVLRRLTITCDCNTHD